MEPLKRRGQRWGQRPASFTHGRTLDLECKFWSLSTSAWGLFVCFLNINTFIVFSPFLAFFASEKIKALCVQTMLLCCPITKHQSTGCQNGLLWGKGPTTLRTRPYPHPHQPAAVRVAWWEPRSSLPLLPCCPATSHLDTVVKRKTNKAHGHTRLLPGSCKSHLPWWYQAVIVCTVRLGQKLFTVSPEASFPQCFLCSE